MGAQPMQPSRSAMKHTILDSINHRKTSGFLALAMPLMGLRSIHDLPERLAYPGISSGAESSLVE